MTGDAGFGDWDQIESRITVLDWPEEAPRELADAIIGLASFQMANVEPSLLEWEEGRLLVWRGYLTGGVLTLYSRLAGLCDDYGLTVLLADPRVEILVHGGADHAHVMGVFRTPKRIGRARLGDLIDRANTGADFVQSIFSDGLSVQQTEIVESVREASKERGSGFGEAPPEAIAEVTPGHVDWALVEECYVERHEEFTPDDELVKSLVTFTLGPWRTELHPPGERFDGSYAESLRWRAVQYKWTAPQATDDSDWVLRGSEHAPVVRVLEHLPPDLHPWARGLTRDAIADANEFARDEEDAGMIRAAGAALAAELEEAEGFPPPP
jgi:hypothetical protein